MKGTDVQGTYKNLFDGKLENVIKCIDVDFESSREEVFNTLQLSVTGLDTIQDSLKQYVAQEKLEGDNQYDTGTEHGKQDARKFIRFKELPAVLQISLNRFEYDMMQDRMVKNNHSFEFDEVLDLESILPQETNQSSSQQLNRLSQQDTVVNKYHLHSILVHRGTLDYGHYYSFIRPSTDEQWYEFNDERVTPVTKHYALKQGQGGEVSEFQVVR